MPGPNLTPIGYVRQVDELFEICRGQGLSRYSMEWGIPSRDLNVKQRKLASRCQGEEQGMWAHAFIYWVLSSKLLQSLHRNRLIKIVYRRRLEKERRFHKKVILGKEPYVPLTQKQVMREMIDAKGPQS